MFYILNVVTKVCCRINFSLCLAILPHCLATLFRSTQRSLPLNSDAGVAMKTAVTAVAS